ncbi:MAG: phosphate acyltransferase PlsX [Campylobacteraceae bacterium]|jgi:glycerol-3-phosphate acyltransferase PlsX|nr:phosphate acyltransferase PlsX [Campylobacteraceae bacterium]
MIKVAIDAMGGDFGPSPIVAGVLEALKTAKFEAILVGDESAIKPLIPQNLRSKISIVHADDVISMHDHATDVFKKKSSSIYVATELVRDGKADAVVSAGHSGATMSLATLRIGRIDGIARPAIATLMPTVNDGQKSLVLDVGANVDCKPEHLYQFGIMGLAYAKAIMGVKKAKVGILTNGEEETKGNEVTKEAALMLKAMPEFIGNVEGNNIFDGSVHVIVCDGFVGNIVLKTSEGVADTIGKFMKHHIKKSAFASFGSVFMRKVFSSLKQQIDYAEYGGAPLLGINGAVIISHGKSNPKAIKNAIFQAINFVKSDVNTHIKASLKAKN